MGSRDCDAIIAALPHLTAIEFVIHSCITMTTSTIRDLRNHFPKVRKLVEAEGEVLLTEKGKPRYRLSLYTPVPATAASPIDYWARLNSYQPQVLTEAQVNALHEENRGDR
jgi:antitoxin (DNA-binding transcriptional repressor) of toxin-antitoxin stability system